MVARGICCLAASFSSTPNSRAIFSCGTSASYSTDSVSFGRRHAEETDDKTDADNALPSSELRRRRLQELSDLRQRGRSADETADACRSLLYGNRFHRAEALFAALLQKDQANVHLDVGLCNVFLEHYFKQKRYSEAEELLVTIGGRADLHTYMLTIRDALTRGDMGRVKRTLGFALAQGLPSLAILGMKGWSMEERAALHPLFSFTKIDRQSVSEYNVDGLGKSECISLPSVWPFVDAGEGQKDQRKISRVASHSGGVDLMAELASVFRGVGGMSEEQLLKAQLRLEETSLRASQELEARKRDNTARLTGIPDSKDMHALLCDWNIQFGEWLRNEIDGRLERGLSITAKENEIVKDSEDASGGLLKVTASDSEYFCALLSMLPPEKTATITVTDLCSLRGFDPELGGVKVVTIAASIGKRVRDEMMAHIALSRPFLQHSATPAASVKRALREGWEGRSKIERTVLQAQERMLEQSEQVWLPSWSKEKSIQLGTWLLSNVLQCMSMQGSNKTATKPFYHAIIFNPSTGQRQGVIRPARAVLDIFLKGPANPATLVLSDPWALPMLTPPRPWLTLNSGGYLSRKTPLVRLRDEPMHEEVIKSADAEGLLETIKQGLDILGSTPWRINRKILDIQIDLWNEGIDLRTLTRFPNITVGPRPKKSGFSDITGYYQAKKEWGEIVRKSSEQLSAKCDSNYKLEIAQMFSNAARFYMPHSVDFRGRAYTVPPHLSHISSDYARGLLLFADERRLGDRGLFWLKVHLANMKGFDKASLEDRASFTESHLQEIRASATNPKGNDFWKTAEEPWQCLAACFELHAALEHSQGPEEYLCALPIQQDGSCNGLQHYAALGGDPEGAAKVNLAPSEAPQDVYRSVAELVALRLRNDLSSATTPPQDRKIAEQLDGKITRKIVKTTVMTNVYGVTEYGAREQLSQRLKEAGLFHDDRESLVAARTYLAKQVFASLKELFVQAKNIQDWLTAASEEIVNSLPPDAAKMYGWSEQKEVTDPSLYCSYTYRRPQLQEELRDNSSLREKLLARYPQSMVSWTTPLNFIVIQPYVRPRTISLLTALQRVNVRSVTPADPIDCLKQSAAFPPNYIHSLDASHMFMTALACNAAGITFASVHDCFWTHAATVDAMSHILRQQFVRLYSEPVLERLRDEFEVRYAGYKVPVKIGKSSGSSAAKPPSSWRPIHFPPVPQKGPFDLRQVLQSVYFFS